jgi:hypothetical protein
MIEGLGAMITLFPAPGKENEQRESDEDKDEILLRR